MASASLNFYLGVHRVNWLEQTDVPLFISTRLLSGRRRLPIPIGRWALDSGAFTELSMFGEFQTTPESYVAAVQRYVDEMGNLDWAAPQDWMCEPWVVAKTGLTVQEHQQRTVDNYLTLRSLAPDLPFVPVLQGWDLSDYAAHVDMYTERGVDLYGERLVGLGSVCRRQSTDQIDNLTWILSSRGLRLHGFGVKTLGLGRYAGHLVSADSMAWSYAARRSQPMPGHGHKSCANCLLWALRWRERVLRVVESRSPTLWDVGQT